MRFASYLKDGAPTFGAVSGEDGLVTLAGRIPGVDGLRTAIERGVLAQLWALASAAKPDLAIADATFLPIIPDASKMLCVGLNYRAHAEEGGHAVKDWPGYFIRVDDSVVGHGQALEAPKVSEQFDYEGELAVVIGKGGRNIAEAEALGHVAGYTCFMDGSVRDYQKRSISAGKNFQSSGSAGPFLVTADEIPDPTRLQLSTYHNGELVQHSGIDMMIHSIPKTIAYVSTIIQLRPGDIVATGTPEGVGRDRSPQRWLRPGDEIAVEIPGVGRLLNPIAAAA
ncbi:fumarylacetoacetate hydrolase family protein [Bosea sp. BK604]|uniref:fumarylacetoacetate hydrolase family protein n=1 Tax=Bosea sp. BK604 TaxID=2512180 RepID=UPI00104A0ED4|nr:fumarylacetoacetate hydrolase family protein [Bosea sp. BK604]TCR70644.1 2-keto-4-pentenoate hydratase/2-oxohepta-3-ene-1,7-dioic acid hydratase in catechol pathway [Bosea sp. BK604]